MSPLHYAVSHSQMEILKLLLDHKGIDINAVDDI